MPQRLLTLTFFLTLGLAAADLNGGGHQRGAPGAICRPFTVKAPDGWLFRGELTLPPGARPGQKFPTVLLVHGSGANDMNETVPAVYARTPGGSANLLLIAKRLNAEGFAVARFNKRGVTGLGPQAVSPKEMVGPAYTPSGITRDALTILQYVRQQPQVDASRLFLLGHSEGTDVVSKIAAEHPNLVRGVVAMGVSGDSAKDALRLQIIDNQVGYAHTFDSNKDGVLSEAEINHVPKQLEVFRQVWQALGVLDVRKSTYSFTPALDKQGRHRVKIAPDFHQFLATYFERTYPDFLFMGPGWGAYMRDAETFGFTTTLLPRFRGPVLLLNGDRDDQTPLSGAVRAYRAIKKSGNPDVTLRVYPGTGHSLAPLRNGATTLGPMNEQSLNDLARWLKAHAD